MKTIRRIILTLTTLVAMIGVSSCQPDWGPDGYYPPANNCDPYLTGTWILVQYNSDNIPVNEANWFYFNGGTGGFYYYYDQWNRPCTEQIRYSTEYYGGSSRNFLQIRYAGGGSMSGSYWFTHNDNTLWIQWTDEYGDLQTYVYDRVRNAPW